jgi:DNA-binding CsgD family transcriptional regulator
MLITEEVYLSHYGTPRHSGRYPWGSGGDSGEGQRSRDFLNYVAGLRNDGLTDTEIARGLGMTTTQFRAQKTIAKNETKQADIAMAQRLKEKGCSNVAIGKQMGINESSVRSLLAPGQKDKAAVLSTTSDMLKKQVDSKGYIDIGTGVESHLGISKEKLGSSVAMLQAKGYEVISVQVQQVGTKNKTTVKVLAPPGTTYIDVKKNMDKIKQISDYSEDGGRSFLGILPPISVDSKRVTVKYAEQGGAAADGVIYVRPNVSDLSLGGSHYAQVRIAVDGTHYLKGMAMYKDDIPKGVDLIFNTNKSDTGTKHDAMKSLKDDPENPFGSVVRQITKPGEKGTHQVTSAMNLVNEAGDWSRWSKNLSSQFLSKQNPTLAKGQLDMTYERRKNDLDAIMSLTNPAVRQKLLEAYSDSVDSAAVHLKAAALPRQQSHVILPINTMKETEVYAPNYRDGERVVLIRYPHGGTFEIPELTVNNKHPEAKKVLGNARDAIGIHSKVAERLSGADFDGDTVLVIPNEHGRVKTHPALDGLKNFDSKASYPKYAGMKVMDERTKGIQMGQISNLITDMTIKGASSTELAQAVRHSMVVIDAEKHELNYKQSAIDNGIAKLKEKYQGSSKAGASTLISKASARIDVPERILRPQSRGGPIDKATGKLVYEETGAVRVTPKGKVIPNRTTAKKLEVADDAFTLSSGSRMEKIYAEHSNKLKLLANVARKEMVNTKSTPYSPSAKIAYANEVASLNAKLNVALRNRPLERQSQLLANTVIKAKREANPGMTSAELKKLKGMALQEARNRTGAKKQQIVITDSEWDAIQAGAITHSKLKDILNNADLDRVKSLATPKTQLLMTSAKTSRAKAMLASGYTQAEIADALGVSLTTLNASVGGA